MTVFVGVSSHYHDSACCLIKDGTVIAAVQEERFSKRKHDPGLPVRAFRYCLEASGVAINDITALAYYEDPVAKAARQLSVGLPTLLTDRARRFKVDPGRAEADLRQSLGYEGPIEFVPHHVSHAASAYLFSGFSESAALVVDGVGEWASTSYGRCTGSEIDLFDSVEFPHSIGLLYSALTAYLGFEVNDGECKVMGLAPYGKPTYLDRLRRLVEVQPDGKYCLDLRYFEFLDNNRMFSERLVQHLGAPPREAESALTAFHHDVAASIQALLEEILLQKVEYLYRVTGSSNLCMAGGVALNCSANRRIRRDGPFENLFVQPAAGDAGGALGAAAVACVRHTGQRPSTERLQRVDLGPEYSSDRIARFVSRTPLRRNMVDFRGDRDALVRATAERLANGKVVGWFQGRMEFGPRALGSRSILADPRRADMRDRINSLVKLRENFRPFAPAVLSSRLAAHFAAEGSFPFMLETCLVRSGIALPAVTHVDGTARVQTVDARTNERFHALLVAFEDITQCPVLLNTSFNLRGDPIAMDPVDALWTFAVAALDVLVLEDVLVDKGARPEVWRHLNDMASARITKRHAAPRGANVYTFF